MPGPYRILEDPDEGTYQIPKGGLETTIQSLLPERQGDVKALLEREAIISSMARELTFRNREKGGQNRLTAMVRLS